MWPGGTLAPSTGLERRPFHFQKGPVQNLGHHAVHVLDVELSQVNDLAIWEYAAQYGYTIAFSQSENVASAGSPGALRIAFKLGGKAISTNATLPRGT